MNQNGKALVIGSMGALLTLTAYNQPFLAPSHSITLGFLVLVFALLVREGFVSV